MQCVSVCRQSGKERAGDLLPIPRAKPQGISNTQVEQRAVSGPVECPWLLSHHTHGGGAHGLSSVNKLLLPPEGKEGKFPDKVID